MGMEVNFAHLGFENPEGTRCLMAPPCAVARAIDCIEGAAFGTSRMAALGPSVCQ